MTVADAAKILEVSPDLVYRLCRAGKLAHARIGLGRGVIRIDRADVDAFLESRRVAAGPPDEPEERYVRTGLGTVKLPGIIDAALAARRARLAARGRGGRG